MFRRHLSNTPPPGQLSRRGKQSRRHVIGAGWLMPSAVRQTWRAATALILTTLLVIGGTVAVTPAARADSFCDTATSDGIGIDFTQPPNMIRSSATALLSSFQQAVKNTPPDAPKSVRILLAAHLALVTKATKVNSAAEAKRLARQSVALSTSVSGRAAVKWLSARCNPPHPVDDTTATKTTTTKTTAPATRPPNPARGTPTPTTPNAQGTFDPCTIIPRQLAATALGVDPGPGESTPTPQGGQCSYGNDVGSIIVSMVKGPSRLGKTAKEAVEKANVAAMDATADATHPVIYHTLTGIGDGAFVAGTGADPTKGFTSASLMFYVGDTFVTILLSFTPATTEPVPRVTALAKSVALLVPH